MLRSESDHNYLVTDNFGLFTEIVYVNSCVVWRSYGLKHFICPLYVFIHFSASFSTAHCALDFATGSCAIEMSIIIIIRALSSGPWSGFCFLDSVFTEREKSWHFQICGFDPTQRGIPTTILPTPPQRLPSSLIYPTRCLADCGSQS